MLSLNVTMCLASTLSGVLGPLELIVSRASRLLCAP